MTDINEQYDELICVLKNAKNQAEHLQKLHSEHQEIYKEFEDMFMLCKVTEGVNMCSKDVDQVKQKALSSSEEDMKKLLIFAEYVELSKQCAIFKASGMKLIILLNVLGAVRSKHLLDHLAQETGLQDLSAYCERVERLARVASEPELLKQRFGLHKKQTSELCRGIKKIEIEPGAIIRFGNYQQTSAGNDASPIEWLVLDYDANENKALLISRYGLDWQKYNDSLSITSWEKCTLRNWLNDTFLKTAFNKNEQEVIMLTNVENSTNQCYSGWKTTGCDNTLDMIFLLSYSEVNKYFDVTETDIINSKSQVVPTPYAIEKGARDYSGEKMGDGLTFARWLLRSPGVNRGQNALINSNGSLASCFVSSRSLVRPALWLDLYGI